MSVATHPLLLDGPQTDLLRELLERERRGLPVEIHHTDNNDFRQLLRDRLKIVEELLRHIENQ